MTNNISRRGILKGAAAAGAAGLIASPAIGQAKWPTRPVQLVCPWGAGGGTDAVVRIVGGMLEKSLGQPFNDVNRTGGSGVVGHSAIATGAPDGYTMGIITSEIAMMHHQGLTQLNHTNYTPLAQMNSDPAGVQVKGDAPYKTIKDLADAIKAAPHGKLKASGTGQGGIWHLALIQFMLGLQLKPDHVGWAPSNGAAPAMQDLAAGGIDFVTCSVPEARAMLDAGRARSLAIMAPARNPQFKDVPTMTETLGISSEVGSWRGIAGPKGLPENVQKIMREELKKVYDSKEYTDFMNSRGFAMVYKDGPDFAKFMAESDKDMGAALTAGGLAKKA